MHYVVGEEPPHKEFGSFIMDSKYLCSLSLFFFSWRETIFIMLSSQLYQTYFSCFCYAKSTMSSGKAVITGTCYFKFWDFFTLQPQTHCFPARAAGFVFSGWFKSDFHSTNLLWESILLWGKLLAVTKKIS